MYISVSFISTFAVLCIFDTTQKVYLIFVLSGILITQLTSYLRYTLVGMLFRVLATWFTIIINYTDQSIHLIPSVYTG